MWLNKYVHFQNGQSLLRLASKEGDLETIKLLLERGFDVDSKNAVCYMQFYSQIIIGSELKGELNSSHCILHHAISNRNTK